MRHLFSALLAAAALSAAWSAPAAALSMGVSGGWSPTDLARPTQLDQLQSSSGVRFRWSLPLPLTEMGITFNNRAQALSPGRNYVFDTAGLALEGGFNLGWLRLGSSLEAAWLRQILPDTAAPGTLRFHNGAGFIVEPYLGVLLPFLQGARSSLELSVHYPLPQVNVDSAIGPRFMFTLWFRDLETPPKSKDGSPEAPTHSPLKPLPAAPPVKQ